MVLLGLPKISNITGKVKACTGSTVTMFELVNPPTFYAPLLSRFLLTVSQGPRELSITDVNAIPVIHGYNSKCKKTLWYNNAVGVEGLSVHTTQDRADHRERRKTWDKAFNIKALRDYEPRLNRHALSLINRLREHASDPNLRISDWINFYSFDVMGDIGFNRSFGMLEKGKPDKIMSDLHNSMFPLSILGHIPWMTNLLLRTPFGVKDLRDFIDWIHTVLVERKKVSGLLLQYITSLTGCR
jgi:cytochrome P450 family 628